MKKLSEIPVYIGQMTFNVFNNVGFDQNQVVAWSSKDFKITTTGKVTGTFDATYNGPSVAYPEQRDFLFVQVRGDYVWRFFGDIEHEPLSDVIPLIAQTSTKHSASFSLDTSFKVPSIMKVDEGMDLDKLQVTLTWVRVYKQKGNYYFHVLPGDASRYYPNIAMVQFDQEISLISGRFGYYEVLSSARGSGRGFDYLAWIKQKLQLENLFFGLKPDFVALVQAVVFQKAVLVWQNNSYQPQT